MNSVFAKRLDYDLGFNSDGRADLEISRLDWRGGGRRDPGAQIVADRRYGDRRRIRRR